MTLNLSTPTDYYPVAGVVLAALGLGWLLGRGHAAASRRYMRHLEWALAVAEGTVRGYQRASARLAAVSVGRPYMPEAPVSGSAPVPGRTVHPVWQVDTSLLPMSYGSATTYRDMRSREWPTTLADLEPSPVLDDAEPCVCGCCPDYVQTRGDKLRSAIRAVPAQAARVLGLLRAEVAGWRRRVDTAVARWRADRAAWRNIDGQLGWEGPDAFSQLRSLTKGGKHRSDVVAVRKAMTHPPRHTKPLTLPYPVPRSCTP